ncbi:hypothetical protein COO72_02635 [Bifidobacterium callitrichos]|nr:hypothetical protein COO72_02635 [Bifidobacterium callitrichos]
MEHGDIHSEAKALEQHGRRPSGSRTAPDADWYAWAKELARQGERPTQGGALEADLAPNLSAAKRTLRRLREQDPELFGHLKTWR